MNVAILITACRLVLAPVLVALAWMRFDRAFLACLICSLASDILDGQLARRCNMATAIGAKMDSWADFLTSLTLLPGLYWLRPDLWTVLRWPLAAAVVSYLLPISIGFLKFRGLTSYHTTLARIAAYLVGAGVVILFAHGPTWPFVASIGVLALAGLEEIAISVVLRSPKSDVHSLRNVLRRRDHSESA